MKNIGFQKIHKFNTATQVSTTFVTDKATATSWATSTNTSSAVTTSTTTTSNWTTEWLTSTSTLTTWSTSSILNFNTSTTWAITVGASSSWSTSSTIQTLKSTSSSFTTQVAKSKSTYYYRSTNYSASTTKYRNTAKSKTTSWTAAVNTTYSYSQSTSSSWTTYYSASTTYSRTTCVSGGGFGGGFQCLPTGTLISINTTTQRPIEELQIGDTILSKGGGFNTDDYLEMHNYDVANMTGQLRETTIAAHFETTSNDNINFNDGLLIATRTHYHLMKIDSRWAVRPIYVAQMYIENSLPVYFYNIDGTETEITTAVSDTTPIQVWEIDTEPDDVYFANGLLTHNHKRNN